MVPDAWNIREVPKKVLQRKKIFGFERKFGTDSQTVRAINQEKTDIVIIFRMLIGSCLCGYLMPSHCPSSRQHQATHFGITLNVYSL